MTPKVSSIGSWISRFSRFARSDSPSISGMVYQSSLAPPSASPPLWNTGKDVGVLKTRGESDLPEEPIERQGLAAELGDA